MILILIDTLQRALGVSVLPLLNKAFLIKRGKSAEVIALVLPLLYERSGELLMLLNQKGKSFREDYIIIAITTMTTTLTSTIIITTALTTTIIVIIIFQSSAH